MPEPSHQPLLNNFHFGFLVTWIFKASSPNSGRYKWQQNTIKYWAHYERVNKQPTMTVVELGLKSWDPTGRKASFSDIGIHVEMKIPKFITFSLWRRAAPRHPVMVMGITVASLLCRRLNLSHLLILICVIVFRLFVGRKTTAATAIIIIKETHQTKVAKRYRVL